MSPTESPAPRSGAEKADLSATQPPLRTFDRGDRARVALPSREQLTHLVERAERHSLNPAEGHLLRLGLAYLESQLVQAGVRIGELRAEVARLEAERDEAQAQVVSSSPLAVGCPFCQAPVGVRCRAMRGARPPVTPHVARIEAAKRLVFAQALGEAS